MLSLYARRSNPGRDDFYDIIVAGSNLGIQVGTVINASIPAAEVEDTVLAIACRAAAMPSPREAVLN